MPKKPSTLGVGIIGGGFIARFHIRSWIGVRDADILVVFDPDAGRAREACALESSAVKASSPRHHATSFPEDPALQKSLPEMTAEEFEASGDLYFGQENYTMAFVQYEKSLALTPGNLRIHYKQGMLFLYAGKHEDAVKSFQKVLEKDPDRAAAYEGMGTAFFEMRQYEQAEKHLLKAVEMDRSLWTARNYLGNIYDFQKKYNEASRQYAEAILLKPDEVVLYNNLGVSLSLAGRYEESVKAFKQALSAKGPKEKVYNSL